MFRFQTTDDWTPNMFQAFMQYCWVTSQSPTVRLCNKWRKDVWPTVAC